MEIPLILKKSSVTKVTTSVRLNADILKEAQENNINVSAFLETHLKYANEQIKAEKKV